MGRGSAQRATSDLATGGHGACGTTPHTPTTAEVVAQLATHSDAMVQMGRMLEELRGRLVVGDADRVRLQQQVEQGEQLRQQDVGLMQELGKKQRQPEDVVKPLLRRSVRGRQQKMNPACCGSHLINNVLQHPVLEKARGRASANQLLPRLQCCVEERCKPRSQRLLKFGDRTSPSSSAPAAVSSDSVAAQSTTTAALVLQNPLAKRRKLKASSAVCPSCSFEFQIRDEGDADARASTSQVDAVIGGCWHAALEAYMLGRQLQISLKPGAVSRLLSVECVVSEVTAGFSPTCSQADIWMEILNRPCSVKVRGEATNLPPAPRTLIDKPITALTLMSLMQLHPVVPYGEEILQLSPDATFSAVVFNGVMYGRLRSQDYISWMNTFRSKTGRWPFDREVSFKKDVHCFIDTYQVETLNRACQTTLELKRFMGASMSIPRRNWELCGLIGADAGPLVDSLQLDTLFAVSTASKNLTDVGQFVLKNIINTLALCPQALLHKDQFPWLAEMLDDSVLESWVGVGTNGADFSTLAQGVHAHASLASADDDHDDDQIVDHTTFYAQLNLFRDVSRIKCVVADENGSTQDVGFEIPALWRKAWVGQLNACKCLAWLIALSCHTVARPRRIKPTSFDFLPHFWRS